MLSIGKLGAGGARYYTDGLGAVDEYYSEAGTRSGVWMGAGAAELGLDGEVEAEVLGRVLEGRDPAGGDRAGGDRAGGERAGGDRGDGDRGDGDRLSGSRSQVPGFDLCFRAPKSVSLLQALGSPEVSAGVLAGHRVAVGEALGWLEREAVMVRRGHAGAVVVPAGGVVGAGFEHFTSRAGDPHLHSHVVVANVARGPDGRWSALDGRALYRQARTAGFLYEAVLRRELTVRLGVEWGPVVNGIADVAGVSRAVVAAFSQRRAQIVAELAAQGASSARAAQVAALSTRPAKDRSKGLGELRQEWLERSAALGMDSAVWEGLVGPGRDPATLDAGSVAERLLGPAGLTARRSVFDRPDVLRAVAELAWDGAGVAEIEAVTAAVLADGRAVSLDSGSGAGGRWSTVELIGVEREVLGWSARRLASGVAVADPVVLGGVLRSRPGLSGEQKAMVEALCRSGDGVQVVVGVAGAGKTYALGAAHEAWRHSGVRVIGTALSARAAEELARGAGIRSSTLAKLTAELADPAHGGLAAGSVVVVDEAAMVSSRELAVLAGHARRAGAKLVLVGDDRQLPSIGAGGLFAALADRLGAVQLLENRRQALTWERDALAELRAGRSDIALAAYHANDRRHHGASRPELCERLVGDWAAARERGSEVMMLATRRADVEVLNQLSRQQLRAAGRLGPDLLEVAGRVFAAGDEVICGRNDPRVGVINGTRGTVTARTPDDDGLIIRTGDGAEIVLPSGYLEAGHLSHGYATTIHKAQGATTERTFVLADEHLYREAGYVALSRGRHRNDLYTAAGRDDTLEQHGPRGADPGDRLTEGLRRSRAQHAATIATAVIGLPGRTVADLEAERRELAAGRYDPQRRRRIDLVGRLIEQRTRALGVWALEYPGPEHLHYLGPAPRQPDRRAEWARAAGELSAYRERHGIAYSHQVDRDGPGRWEQARLEQLIHDVEPALDRSQPLEPVREHDRGLSL